MLFIYGVLSIGGIETFFVRLAKQRSKSNLKTKIILLSKRENSNPELLSELLLYAEVYFIGDIFYGLGIISSKLHLLAPLKKDVIRKIFIGIKHIHVTHGAHAFFAMRLTNLIQSDFYITVGFYHSREFSWGDPLFLPYYERKNREFIFYTLPKSNIYTFSESVIELYRNVLDVDLSGAATFRIGVIERTKNEDKNKLDSSLGLKICSVGRLVDFKTYNLWMLDVIKQLILKGISVEYHIYGTGPLSVLMNKKILDLGLNENVILKGNLDYNEFDKTVSNYNIFVGSGTSIIQASSLGVCSIIAIESNKEPNTYGFFNDNFGIDYNFEQPKIKRYSVLELIIKYVNMSEKDKDIISKEHIKSVESFYMDTCSLKFDDVKLLKYAPSINYSKTLYTISYFIQKLKIKLKINSAYDVS